jgi:hypothetical protein
MYLDSEPAERAPVHHMSSGSESHQGSGATTCIMAPDPLGGLQCAACVAALDLASLQGGL